MRICPTPRNRNQSFNRDPAETAEKVGLAAYILSRCIMTTLTQGSLPKDPGVLRTAVKDNDGNIGVYATVVGSGRVCRGDAVELS